MNATGVLQDEHQGILAILDVLGELGKAAQRHKLNRDDAAKVIGFLRNFADRCHHGKEEKQLFPAMAAAGMPVENGPIGVMLAEHERGRAFIKDMSSALEDAGPSGDRAFTAAAAGYKDLLGAHIGKENGVLFPQAERLLSERDKDSLQEAYEKIEREEMGEGTHERYHAMIGELVARYHVGQDKCGCEH